MKVWVTLEIDTQELNALSHALKHYQKNITWDDPVFVALLVLTEKLVKQLDDLVEQELLS